MHLFEFCADDPDLEYQMIDATIDFLHNLTVRMPVLSLSKGIRARASCLPAIALCEGWELYARSLLKNPLKFIVTPGQHSNFTKANELIGAANGSYVIGDKGYDKVNRA